MVLTTSQKRRRAGEDLDVKIITPSKHVSPTPVEKLLGSWIHQDLKWSEHLQDNKDSLIKSLISRINALKIIGRVAPFKTRKMIADGIFTSKLSYLIALWGGADKYLIKSLQTIQTKAAKIVTKLDWNTPTMLHLSQCGWLSVHQLAVYHTVLLVFRVLSTGVPHYLYNMFSQDYTVHTRRAASGAIKPAGSQIAHLDLVQSSFKWRAVEQFNLLPSDIRNSNTVPTFKRKCKFWILRNIPVNPD